MTLNTPARFALVSGALLAGVMVALGAFGSHALADQLTPERLHTFRTGAQYGFYHALALMVVGLIAAQLPGRGWWWPIGGLALGIALFTGSLTALVLLNIRQLGLITPVGGSLWILSWLSLAWQVYRYR